MGSDPKINPRSELQWKYHQSPCEMYHIASTEYGEFRVGRIRNDVWSSWGPCHYDFRANGDKKKWGFVVGEESGKQRCNEIYQQLTGQKQ